MFGGFWGTWGAAVPAVRDRADVGDGQLGTALLFVGAGALPAMLLAGRAIDRWGHRVTGAGLGGLVMAGLLLAIVVRDMVTLSAALLLVGAVSAAWCRRSRRSPSSGTIGLAVSTTEVTALAGLAVAAAGTAVLFPTVLSVATRQVREDQRGRVTSLVTVVAYLGFVFGQVYVGRWSEAAGLPGAMIAVAGLAGLLATLTVPVVRATTGSHATAAETT